MGRALIFNEQGFFASVEGFYNHVMTNVPVLACHSSLQAAPGGEISLQ
jgi:hypothetical protein